MDDSVFLDRFEALEERKGVLPHWQQRGVKLYFITMHQSDSLPGFVCDDIAAQRERFMTVHPRPWDSTTENRFRKLSSEAYDRYLNNGYGSCLLRSDEACRVVEGVLAEGNQGTYYIVNFAIAANHIHILAEFYVDEEDASDHVEREVILWKKKITYRINRLYGRTGRLFHRDFFERMIRNSLHYHNVMSYIYRHNYHPKLIDI